MTPYKQACKFPIYDGISWTEIETFGTWANAMCIECAMNTFQAK